MTTQEEFDAASQRAQQLPTKPSNTVLLQLYGLYKQATEGDVTGDRPGGFDFKAIAKYDAWTGLRGRQMSMTFSYHHLAISPPHRCGHLPQKAAVPYHACPAGVPAHLRP
ncbi:hypothetical protein BEN47_14440 [Hymenobacter lapidarius]|uniref:ACB domain-containing protein n=1 Tax=Hymenobacter lapidarius TaxID=1908237 RepID=A0A1G1T4J6_9BACT|nr:acyl-CoA-binding protein [Hymenobacter lapidarius]OGX85788.1 hypothetical protein BEN47_14440 [Hymenobacter lapidarius]